jgi:hypothetical protein
MVFLFRGKNGARPVSPFALSALTKYVSLAATLPLLRRGRGRLFGSALAVGVALWALASRGGVTRWGPAAVRREMGFNAPVYSGLVALMDAGNVPDRAKGLFMDPEGRPRTPGLDAAALSALLRRVSWRAAALGILLAAALGIIAWKVG